MEDMFTSDERKFMESVREFSGIGYGRMMQLISYEWANHLHSKGYPTDGVFITNCLAMSPDWLQSDWWGGLRSDPLFKDSPLAQASREAADD